MTEPGYAFYDVPTVTRTFERPSRALLDAARRFSSATLHEASGQRGALPSALKPVDPSMRICGPALTVHAPPGDNLWLHRAIVLAQPGDVLIAGVDNAYEHGYWGEIMSTAASARGVGGLVIDGCVRDGALLGAIGIPVFARGLCIRGTTKDFAARGWLNSPLRIADVTVRPGDLIVGDGDGVVVVERERIAETLAAAEQREAKEASVLEQLRRGETTLGIYGWDR
ncbi:MAG TPA: 4-carboxy-4-hydroxy-2-oxoadipate aldolase/oxaloacetate decarboxylase [Candidatus Acidoferrum sp.]|nr:4-carboxy-4-hydroxy-2-oxoadipate aldolase/oxaloacetate decarboxylase [Candidatus Acidoferrum sp.]